MAGNVAKQLLDELRPRLRAQNVRRGRPLLRRHGEHRREQSEHPGTVALLRTHTRRTERTRLPAAEAVLQLSVADAGNANFPLVREEVVGVEQKIRCGYKENGQQRSPAHVAAATERRAGRSRSLEPSDGTTQRRRWSLPIPPR